MTLLDLQNTSSYLAYLGFNFLENDSQKSAIHSKFNEAYHLYLISYSYSYYTTFNNDVFNDFPVTREKKVDIAKKQSSRNVYQCHIIGPRSCGKTSICRSFLGIAHKVRDDKKKYISLKCKYYYNFKQE